MDARPQGGRIARLPVLGHDRITGVPYSPADGWNALAAQNPDLVLDELVCFGC